MPELPEVEVARRATEEHCVGKKIVKSIIANETKVIDGVSASDFEASLLGKTIVSAHRKGKNMWLQLDSPPFPSFQFGMTGAIYIKGVAVTKYKRSAVKDTDEWPSKYSKFFVELDDGLELSFTDKRRFAKVRLLEDPASVPPISELGPDALLEPMKDDEFSELLSKKKIAIKALLLDQSFISGIGNWIADEVLYQARIHPLQIASSLSKESCVTLLKCIKEVIEKAIEVGADSSQFPNNWIFHYREKKPGEAFVDGKKVDFITAGGRTTAYVPELQKLNGVQAAKVVVKRRKQTSKRKDGGDDDENNGVDGGESDGEEVTENVKSKRGRKPGVQGKKPSKKRKSKESDDDDNNDDDNNNDNDNNNADESPKKEVKSKRGRKPAGQGKKPSKKRKSKESDDDDNNDDSSDDDSDDNNADESPKKEVKSKRGRKPADQYKKPSNKSKSKESDDDDDDDENGDELQKTNSGKARKATNNKQAKALKTSEENVMSQKSKKPKKKAK